MKIMNFLSGKTRFVAAAAVAAALGGGAYAFAASLTVTTTTLGSGSTAVTNTCNLSTSYTTTYTALGPQYNVTSISVTGSTATACKTLTYKVTVGGTSGTSLEEFTGTLDPTGDATLTPSSTINAATVDSITAVVQS